MSLSVSSTIGYFVDDAGSVIEPKYEGNSSVYYLTDINGLEEFYVIEWKAKDADFSIVECNYSLNMARAMYNKGAIMLEKEFSDTAFGYICTTEGHLFINSSFETAYLFATGTWECLSEINISQFFLEEDDFVADPGKAFMYDTETYRSYNIYG